MEFYTDRCLFSKEYFFFKWVEFFYSDLIVSINQTREIFEQLDILDTLYTDIKFWNKKWIVWKLDIIYTIFSFNFHFFSLFKCFMDRSMHFDIVSQVVHLSSVIQNCKFTFLSYLLIINQNYYSNGDKWNADYSGKLTTRSYISDNNRSVIPLVIVLISRVLEFHIMECGRSGIRSSMFG